MTVVPIRAPAPDSQSETEVAWHIFCALSQYHAANPAVESLPAFGQAVLDAHEKWGRLFAK